VRGNHQFGFGANLNYFKGNLTSTGAPMGTGSSMGRRQAWDSRTCSSAASPVSRHGGPNR
jgi:hypothetical protein